MSKTNAKLSVELENDAERVEFIPVPSSDARRGIRIPSSMNIPAKQEELMSDEAKKFMRALVEWYKFNDVLQKLFKESEDDINISPLYRKYFEEPSNAIHDVITGYLVGKLDDYALTIAF